MNSWFTPATKAQPCPPADLPFGAPTEIALTAPTEYGSRDIYIVHDASGETLVVQRIGWTLGTTTYVTRPSCVDTHEPEPTMSASRDDFDEYDHGFPIDVFTVDDHVIGAYLTTTGNWWYCATCGRYGTLPAAISEQAAIMWHQWYRRPSTGDDPFGCL